MDKSNKNQYRNKNSRKRSHPGGGDDEDIIDERTSYNERHKGSYDLDELKATSEYKNRVEYSGPKRKYALCFGYLGSKYQGLQLNPDVDSVEKELERALFLSGGIPECNYGNLQKIQWSRAARTDAGVHAVAQNCSMKLSIPTDIAGRESFMNAVNSYLPTDIRLHTISKVTKGFNAKLYCVRRRYHYLLPTYMLSRQEDVDKALKESLDSSHVQTVLFTTFSEIPGESVIVQTLSGESLLNVRNALKSFRVTPDILNILKEALQRYVGTNNYHNFTSGKSFNEANSKRYILSFDCSEPILASTGVEYVLLSIVGQSFLLNQIRKMVGVAVDVARGMGGIDRMDAAFSQEKFDIPMVPGVGLYLDELFYDGYNGKIDYISAPNKSKSSTEAQATPMSKDEKSNDKDDDEDDSNPAVHEKIEWQSNPKVGPLIDEFRKNIVWPHIFAEEERGLEFATYFDYRRISSRHHTLFNH